MEFAPILYVYDNLGRLTGQSDPLGHVVVYTVDGLGRTTALHQNGRSEQWAFRPDGALATYTDFAGRVTSFAYDNDQLLTGIDYPAGMADVSYGYDAFGNLRRSTGTGATHLGYTGELQDQTTGLVYLRARFYHPVLGRFLQRDSFGGFPYRPQSLNRYAYTENNPVNHRDPSGHFIDTILDAGFLAYDIYRLVYDNILHDCDNLNANLFSLLLDVGGLLLPG